MRISDINAKYTEERFIPCLFGLNEKISCNIEGNFGEWWIKHHLIYHGRVPSIYIWENNLCIHREWSCVEWHDAYCQKNYRTNYEKEMGWNLCKFGCVLFIVLYFIHFSQFNINSLWENILQTHLKPSTKKKVRLEQIETNSYEVVGKKKKHSSHFENHLKSVLKLIYSWAPKQTRANEKIPLYEGHNFQQSAWHTGHFLDMCNYFRIRKWIRLSRDILINRKFFDVSTQVQRQLGPWKVT